jgi:heme-degrading monooxygenase HmoA
MILRIWRTLIDPSKRDDYLEFARSRSLPMFREQPGLRAVFFAADRADRAVVTLWDRGEDVEALDSSESYQQTVAAIEQAGFLRGDSTVELFDVEGGFLCEGGFGFEGGGERRR